MINPNDWPDIKKIKYHLKNGDGFMIRDSQVVFQGRNYLGYAGYSLTPAIKKLLKEYEDSILKGGVKK